MSSSRRKQSARSNVVSQLPAANVMSGAEMLVLQQNIKHYIITRQARALTFHELEEFEKIKDLLLPNLFRYSQATGPSLTEAAITVRGNDSSSSGSPKSRKAGSSQSNGKAAPSQITPKLQSTTLLLRPLDEPDSHGPPISNKGKAKTASKPKRITVKQESLDFSNGPDMAQSSSQAGANGARTLVANAVKKGTRKRSKIEVYQDPEDAQQKRPRLKKRRANADDLGKENLDPLDNIPSKTAKKVLRDSTNAVNNTAKITELKDKEVVRNSDSRKTSAKSTALVESKISPGTQQQQQRQKTNSYPIISSSATTGVENTTKRTRQIPVVRNPDYSRPAVSHDAELPSENEGVPAQYQEPITRDPGLSETDRATKNTLQHVVKIEPDDFANGNIATQPKEPENTSNTLLRNADVIEILASVDDDNESADSFATYIKAERSTQSVSAAPGRIADAYDDIQESQSSQGSKDLYSPRGSLEETFPMPGFLLPELPDDIQDESTFPMPYFLSSCDLPEDSHRKADGLELALDEEHVNESQAEVDEDNGVVESTNFVDGVWCIDEFKNRVNSTVCSHQERWIAVETTSDVQLWQLSDPDDLCESKWCRRIQMDKNSKHPIQVMFAPNDSFAVVFNPMECTLIKISLEDASSSERSMTRTQKLTWIVATPLTSCGGLIVERKTIVGTTQASFQLVFGTDEPGSICLIPIPDNDHTVSGKNMLTEKLHYPGTNEIVSSVAKVSNTSTLILASFGPALVMWDLDRQSNFACEADIAPLLSLLPSPLLAGFPMTPIIMSATVPAQFFKEYHDELEGDGLSPSEWPVLAVIRMCDLRLGNPVASESDQCALYVMKGNTIELVHKYQGSESISSASSSSRYVACQTNSLEGGGLYLWDILRPEAVMQLSLCGMPSRQSIASLECLKRQQGDVEQHGQSPAGGNTRQENEGKDLLDRPKNVDLDIFSAGSTLSSPPEDLSSPCFLSVENKATADEKCDPVEPGSRHESVQPLESLRQQAARNFGGELRQPKDWINLPSVSWMERNQIKFSAQVEQRWIVVTRQDMLRESVSAVHIMALKSILPTASA